jgi:chromosome segregation ATPase
METSEEQLKALKIRIRSLERALAESEELSLEQVECTHRLEQQLFELRNQLESYRHENQLLRQRPTQEELEEQSQHAKELQLLIWELERRLTPEQHQLLLQQLETSRSEIEMLKGELKRRVDPSHLYQLQHELAELKEYANHLGEYAVRLPQIQLQHAQSQLQTQELESELAELREKLSHMEKRPTEAEVEEQMSLLRQEHESIENELRTQLRSAQLRVLQLESRSPDQALLQQIDELETKLALTEAERDALQALSLRTTQHAEHLEVELEKLSHQLTMLQEHTKDLEQRPPFNLVNQWQLEIAHLQDQLGLAQAQQEALQAELDQRNRGEEDLAYLHRELDELRAQLTQTQTEYQLMLKEVNQKIDLAEGEALHTEIQQLREDLRKALSEKESLQRELSKRPNWTEFEELKRRQELAEAHHIVSKKQVDQLHRQIEELKAECVQAHAYAQTQEKEVAFLERRSQELESQLAMIAGQKGAGSPSRSSSPTLPHFWHSQPNPSRKPDSPNHDQAVEPKPTLEAAAEPGLVAESPDHYPNGLEGQKTAPTPEAGKVTSSLRDYAPHIPPFSLDDEGEDQQPEPLLQRRFAAPQARPHRIELPGFVKQRR